ncbi:MAG: bis(5'-nucleosyl)-tetraphosphatase (symmetrical) YqeK [Vulcanimicrobiaceae bacterium]
MTGSAFVALARRVRAEIGGDHRYAHTLRVARLAGRLARRHGEDAGRARLAGMLHDLARLYSAARLVSFCEARGLEIDAFEAQNPIVLHARVGAALARERFGVTDPDVLAAIACHTVAAPAMSRLATIVYLADGLEPGRTFPDRARYAELACADLEGGMAALLGATVTYLQGRQLEVAPQTLAALATYESRQRRPLSA